MDGHNAGKNADGARLATVNEATRLRHQITQAIDVRHETSHNEFMMHLSSGNLHPKPYTPKP